MQTTTIPLIQQDVLDVHLRPLPGLVAAAAELWRYCQDHFATKDKIPAEIRPLGVDGDGAVQVQFSGAFLAAPGRLRATLEQSWPLGLTDYKGPLDPRVFFPAVPGARTTIGGNVPNMGSDLALLATALGHMADFAADVRLAIVSPGDPLAGLPADLASEAAPLVRGFHLEIEKRLALHVALDRASAATLVLTTQPQRVSEALEALLSVDAELRAAIATARVIVSGDPIRGLIGRSGIALSDKVFMMNPPTAFRSMVANSAFGRGAILPMNAAEAKDTCQVFMQRAHDADPKPDQLPSFASPFRPDRVLSPSALRALDRSLTLMLFLDPPLRFSDRFALTCPITFGAHGGVLVSAGDDNIACATTVPDDAGAARLAAYADPELVDSSRRPSDVGAGDAHAAVIAFLNALDPALFVRRHAAGRRLSPELLRLAGLVFAGVLSRLASGLVLMTAETYMPIRPARLAALLDDVAVSVADAIGSLHFGGRRSAGIRIAPWGVNAVVWRVSRLAQVGPSRQSEDRLQRHGLYRAR